MNINAAPITMESQIAGQGMNINAAPITMESQVAEQVNAPVSAGMVSGYAAQGREAEMRKRAQDFSGEERAIEAQMAMAQQLRGREAPKGRTVGPYDVYVGPNWGESVAGLTNSIGGGLMQRSANKKDIALDEKRTESKLALAMEAENQRQAAIDLDAVNRAEDNVYRNSGRDLELQQLEATTARNKSQDTLNAIEREKLDIRHKETVAESARRWEAEQKAKRLKAEFEEAKEEANLPKEIAALDATSTVRQNAIEKGSKFLQAFESGAESGTTRSVASIIPGQWTDQGAFDEELDAFAEQAARAELQARGEIRPTDADVKGMKESLFGAGKGEQVNKNLLTDYLANQIGTENQLREFKGEELIEMPNTTAIEGDWYGQLFEGEKPARKFTDEQIDNMSEEELDANGL